MTIRFIKSWNGYYEGQIVTNPAGRSEADLVAMGYAVTDLDGPDNSPLPVKAQTNPLTGGIVKTIANLTQAQYDALAVKDPEVLYVIVG